MIEVAVGGEIVEVGGVTEDGRPYITAEDILRYRLGPQMEQWGNFFIKDDVLDVWFGPKLENDDDNA